MDRLPAQAVRFGGFELDVRAGELRKGGRRIRLQEQPFQILLMLLEHPGEVVTREEIRKRLWPNDTIVEFEHSIGTAIMKLRQALGDDAGTQRFVETLPRRGFRFISPLDACPEPSKQASDDLAAESPAAAPEELPPKPANAEEMAGAPVGISPGIAAGGQPAGAAPETAANFTHSDLLGRAVSHYRILERLGGGGMGIVYKAEDTKLGRRVALKFLPTGLADDPVALARFEREARAASALNHPHICTIYEIEEVNGQPFLAMELMEGKTLKHLINGKPLPTSQLLDLGMEIADALESAHAAGIIHRDIKPANIFVTKRGDAKVLDFGLAKLQGSGIRGQGSVNIASENSPRPLGGEGAEPSEAGEGVSAHDTPTLSIEPNHLTIAGAAMGTAAYMSPEQARGEEVDARTDLFSFGAVLYEMATGQQAFSGATSAELREAILTRQATPPQRLNPALDPRLQAIIEKALEKDCDVRYQHASEIRADLKRLKRDTEPSRVEAGLVPAAQGRPRGVPVRWVAIAMAGAVVLGGATLAYWITRPPAPPPQLKEHQLTFNPSENAVLQGTISPDGKYLAYGDQRGLHLKLIHTGEVLNIRQSEGPALDRSSWWPTWWFPDGTKFIADTDGPTSWVVSVMGGPPRKLRDDADVSSVSPDGNLIAFDTGLSFFKWREIWLMGPQGQEPRSLISGSEDDNFRWPVWSPTGQRIAYAKFHRNSDKLECSLESRDLKGGQPTLILSDPGLCNDIVFLWNPGGRFIYTKTEPPPDQDSANLWEIKVDPRTGQAVGKPRRLTDWTEVFIMLVSSTQDGKQLAVTKHTQEADVYVGELEAGGRGLKQPRRLTLDEHNDYPAGWMPDNKTVLFWSDRNGTMDIFKQALDQDAAELVVTGPDYKDNPVVSPDGSWILYLSRASPEFTPTTPIRITRVPISGGPPQLVLEGRGINHLACAKSPATLCVFSEESPDQKQLIYSAFEPAQEQGRRELTRVPLPIQGWDLSPDGTRLALAQYESREGRIQIVSLAGGLARAVKVKGSNGLGPLYWAADGKGFFVSDYQTGSTKLLYLDLERPAKIRWDSKLPGGEETWGIPSPNGHYLAVLGYSAESNVWMLENF